MYKYPTPAFGAASFAAAATAATTAAAVAAAPTAQDHDAQSKATDTIRGFAFDEGFRVPVKELATKPASILQTSSLQELGRLAASASPYNNVPERLKTQMMKDLATKSTSVFVLSPDGKFYQEPVAVRGVPVERIDETSPY
ncbi:subunit IV of cytochrome c oxidase [Beauveria brongniartii RCEF 3172]|uniref:Subunit IV of cytochrome c oxidase n=1 Tax=Beauveria brongniartii RCEF 3172 TaxID=1081107 RepID=A0A166XAV8_9HYPO|nr:subunit IV of cytochrome c oxidase [Beauveria brongniartii RCEF 3172]